MEAMADDLCLDPCFLMWTAGYNGNEELAAVGVRNWLAVAAADNIGSGEGVAGEWGAVPPSSLEPLAGEK